MDAFREHIVNQGDNATAGDKGSVLCCAKWCVRDSHLGKCEREDPTLHGVIEAVGHSESWPYVQHTTPSYDPCSDEIDSVAHQQSALSRNCGITW